MKHFILLTLISTSLLIQPSLARTVEIDVFGMTCPFCVDSLERKFGKMESVIKVEVSLKLKKIRLETKEDSPTLESIKQAVLDTGFTPTKITVLEETETKDSEKTE